MLHDSELSLLLNFSNVLITAPQAFLTREALRETARVTTANVHQLGPGEPFLAGVGVKMILTHTPYKLTFSSPSVSSLPS